MKFDKKSYPEIKRACESQTDIEFEAPKENTIFSQDTAPARWTAYPPAILPAKDYAKILIYAGTDARGSLMKLTLLAHLQGGRVYYKKVGEDTVGIKVVWPK